MAADPVPLGARPAGGHPGAVVASRTARKAARSGVLWGYVFGLTVASSALGYVAAYKTAAERARLATLFGTNAGLAAINGPARQIQTVAGYTVWKSFMFLMVIGAVWGLLTSTRLLRGEEDAGRWEVLLAGQSTRRSAAAQALAGLATGLVAMWALTAVVTVVVGHDTKVRIPPGAALFFALALVAPAAMFLAAGAVASQLASSRRQAAAYAGVALGVAYAVRLVADSAPTLVWLRWLSPLGWAEELQPVTGARPLALLPVVAFTALSTWLAVALAGRRDLGSGLWPSRTSAPARTRLLGGPTALAVRLGWPVVLAWSTAVAATALLMGFIAKPGGRALTSSASVERVMARLGAGGGSAASYLGFTFVAIEVMVAFVAAGQVSSARAEEASGRLEHLLVRPVRRWHWFAGRALTGGLAVAGCGLVAGLFAWAGAASQGAGVGIVSLLGAGANLVPPALFILGVGLFVLGAWPGAAGAVTYGVLAWSVLVEVTGAALSHGHWLEDTSVFHQMAAAPATAPDWASAVVVVGVGVAAAALGTLAFGRRDLRGE